MVESLGPQIDFTGPIFVGIVLNWCLLGSLLVQIYVYSLNSEKDRISIKSIVYFLLLADLLQTGLATDHAWKTLVKHWGDPDILINVPRTAISLTIMNGIISAVVQIFFAWRIWYLASNKIGRAFSVLIVLIALMQCISAIVASIRFTLINNLALLPSLSTGFTVWLAGSFAADILIAGCMVYILRKAQARSFSNRTDSIVTKLIANTIQTGAVTAVAAGVELILFKVSDKNFHETPAFLLGKLYSNVLLANLNARAQNKRLGMDTNLTSTAAVSRSDHTFQLSKMTASSGTAAHNSKREVNLESGVAVRVQTVRDDDHLGKMTLEDQD